MRLSLIILFYIPVSIFSQNNIKVDYEWYISNSSRIENTIKDINVNSEHMIDTLVNIWKNRDGAIGLEVSEYIVLGLIHKPNETLKVFASYPKSFKDWVNDIPENVLTDYGKGSGSIKNERELIICSLNKYKVSKKENRYKKMADKIIHKLNNTKLRVIE